MTTVDALKEIYAAMGGTVDNVSEIDTIPEMLSAIATLVSSGATNELPTVTADDNGKVLKVVNGEWTTAAAE